MSVYMTEEEQLEAIKKWWHRYQSMITVILSIILLIYSGNKYWHWHQEKVQNQASATFEQLMVAFSNQDNKSIRSYANHLINDFSKTVYADAAHMTLAKIDVVHEHFTEAMKHLDKVATNSKVLPLKQVARIRLARLLANQKSYDKALAELATMDDSAYKPVVNELKGDIYAATGHYQKAVLAYKEAIAEVRERGMGNLFLEMKTNGMAAKLQNVNADSIVQTA